MMSVSPVTRKTSLITSNLEISVAIRSASFVSTFKVMTAATWSSPYRAVRACSMSLPIAISRGMEALVIKVSAHVRKLIEEQAFHTWGSTRRQKEGSHRMSCTRPRRDVHRTCDRTCRPRQATPRTMDTDDHRASEAVAAQLG